MSIAHASPSVAAAKRATPELEGVGAAIDRRAADPEGPWRSPKRHVMMPAAVRAGRSKPRHTAFGIALALFGTLNDFLGSYCGGRIGTVNAKGHARLRTVDLQSRSAASSFRSSLTQQLGGLGAHLVRIPAEEIRDQLG
jgi:hypothetical protein